MLHITFSPRTTSSRAVSEDCYYRSVFFCSELFSAQVCWALWLSTKENVFFVKFHKKESTNIISPLPFFCKVDSLFVGISGCAFGAAAFSLNRTHRVLCCLIAISIRLLTALIASVLSLENRRHCRLPDLDDKLAFGITCF